MLLIIYVSRHASGPALRRLATFPRSFTNLRAGVDAGARCSWSELRRPHILILDSIYNLQFVYFTCDAFTNEVSLISIDIHERIVSSQT